jgi:hypothetical protein
MYVPVCVRVYLCSVCVCLSKQREGRQEGGLSPCRQSLKFLGSVVGIMDTIRMNVHTFAILYNKYLV